MTGLHEAPRYPVARAPPSLQRLRCCGGRPPSVAVANSAPASIRGPTYEVSRGVHADQAHKLLVAARADLLEALYVLALYLGLRRVSCSDSVGGTSTSLRECLRCDARSGGSLASFSRSRPRLVPLAGRSRSSGYALRR